MPSPEALHGVLGHYVRETAPLTEADPWAVLVHGLVFAGNMIGNGPHIRIGADSHTTSVFAGLVGDTSRGRKGSAASIARLPFRLVDAAWSAERVLNGFGSGEGLIRQVADPKGDDAAETYWAGDLDRRLCILEPEFARLLRKAGTDGSTVSMIVRDAWDGGRLSSRTKDKTLVASHAHLSMIGHITKSELAKELDGSDVLNGFANRFLWIVTHRSRRLPFGGDTERLDMLAAGCAKVLRGMIGDAAGPRRLQLADDARPLWEAAYDLLGQDDLTGAVGAVTARAEPITLRLALIYALLDGERLLIRREHLAAALAVVDHGLRSAEEVFSAGGESDADRLLRILVDAGEEGRTRTELSNALKRHWTAERLDAAVSVLEEAGEVRRVVELTGGAPRTTLFATGERQSCTPDLLGLVRAMKED